jgi:hypothetical protein
MTEINLKVTKVIGKGTYIQHFINNLESLTYAIDKAHKRITSCTSPHCS